MIYETGTDDDDDADDDDEIQALLLAAAELPHAGKLTIFLFALGEAQLESLWFRTRWQHNSPPNHQQHCVPTVTQHLHGRRILHVLK